MSGPSSWQQLLLAAFVAWVSGVLYVVMKAWPSRALFNRLRKQGLPMPEHTLVLGHLGALGKVQMTLPLDAHQNYLLAEMSKPFMEKDQPFYLSTWPFGSSLMIVTSPPMAIQVCQEFDLGKPEQLQTFFRPFTGGDNNLFMMNGPEWKKLHSVFAPGFAASYVLAELDLVVREAEDLVLHLREHAAKGDMFSLDELLLNFTMDVIGAVSMNSRFRSQRQYNELASSMRSQVNWHCADGEINLLKRWNPIRPFAQWNNARKMNNYISNELDKRFAERQSSKDGISRSIIDLVLDDYMKTHPAANAASKLDPDFKNWATVQLRLFLFVGHDSTASTLVYCYHSLSKHPEAMRRIRAEHHQVFGSDLSTVAAQLIASPHLINQLPYTIAVLKETMRLFPIASAVRAGDRDTVLTDSKGVQYPTEDVMILVLHNAIHRNPNYWVRPEEFLPERFLVGPEHPLYPVRGAWRPFEFGPRNCTGQTLAMLDMKTTLVMTLREFEIGNAYQEWDGMKKEKGVRSVWGERAYQVFAGSAHPSDGFPCRVKVREQK